MWIIEVDEETLKLILKYNDLTEKWLNGCAWFDTPNLTKIQLEKGEERLLLRLNQLSEVYNKLISLGIEVQVEEYLDTNKYILKPPF